MVMSFYVPMHTQLCDHLLHLPVVPVWPQAYVYRFGIKRSSASCQASLVEHTAIFRGQRALICLATDHNTNCL